MARQMLSLDQRLKRNVGAGREGRIRIRVQLKWALDRGCG